MQNISAPNSQIQNVQGVIDDDDDDTVLAEDGDGDVSPTPLTATRAAFNTTSKTNDENLGEQKVNVVEYVFDEDHHQKTAVSSQGMDEVVNGVDKGQQGSTKTKATIAEAEPTNIRADYDMMLGTTAGNTIVEVKKDEETSTLTEPEPELKQYTKDENETKEQEDRCGGIPYDGSLSGPKGQQQHSLYPRPLNGEIAGQPQQTISGQSG